MNNAIYIDLDGGSRLRTSMRALRAVKRKNRGNKQNQVMAIYDWSVRLHRPSHGGKSDVEH